MNTKHTPGPWNSTRASAGGHNIITSEVAPLDVCVVSKAGKSAAEIDANCALIAAAPELLAAVRSAHHMLTRDYIDPAKLVVIEKCSAAFAKATGEELF